MGLALYSVAGFVFLLLARALFRRAKVDNKGLELNLFMKFY